MMTDNERRAAAERLLEEMRADPLDWPSVDVGKLLDLWGLTESVILPGAKGFQTMLRYHPEAPQVTVLFYWSEKWDPEQVRRLVDTIDRLRRLI